jgi:multidrug efflux pump subunit AcrA (membrane-fusion protein)
MKNILQKAVILPLIVIIAVAFVIFKVRSKPPIEHQVLQFPVKTVEVITARKIPFRARATAYGNVEPAVLVLAKAEVAGKISYIHPLLKQGGTLAQGTVALRIEPTTFEFSLTQSQAVLAASQSALVQLEVEENTTRGSLDIARKNLEVGKKELDRLLIVWEKKLISRSVVDAEEQKVLQLRQQVEDLKGKLTGFTSRKAATQAQIRQSESQLAQSQDTLGRTEVRVPFDARIGEVLVEKGGFTAIGNVLFEASGVQAVEINAQLPIRQFRPLFVGRSGQALSLQTPAGLQAALLQMQLEARVSLVGFEGDTARWKGDVLRISESIDPTRDTLGVVVAVNNPYEGVIPGKRPPLLKGMYTAVELFVPAKEILVLPRKAIHEGRVYIANDNNQLEIREVTILHRQGRLVILDGGVEEGEKVIITDVIPVINGLPLKPIEAVEYEKQMARDALGVNGNAL